jgi:ribosomal protein S18 acetylase RimI-like enzyme
MLVAAGLPRAFGAFTMVLDPLPGAPAGVPLPDGLAWVDLPPALVPALHATLGRAFATVPFAYVPSLAAFTARCALYPVPPRVLTDGTSVAAFVRVTLEGEEGELAILGRDPGRRGQGLGAAAVIEGLRGLAERGARRVRLEVVADNRRALALYEATGFRAVAEMAVHRRQLR